MHSYVPPLVLTTYIRLHIHSFYPSTCLRAVCFKIPTYRQRYIPTNVATYKHAHMHSRTHPRIHTYSRIHAHIPSTAFVLLSLHPRSLQLYHDRGAVHRTLACPDIILRPVCGVCKLHPSVVRKHAHAHAHARRVCRVCIRLCMHTNMRTCMQYMHTHYNYKHTYLRTCVHTYNTHSHTCMHACKHTYVGMPLR